MQGRTLAALCAGIVAGCAGPAQLPSAPPRVEQIAIDQAAVEPAAEIVTVSLVTIAALQQDVVCRDRTRPGSRIRAGQDCRLRSSQAGVAPDALRDLDTELKRRGYTEGQVDVDNGLGTY